MALVPITLRPSFIVRRNATRKGILGPSTFWKLVAVVVFGRSTIKKIFGKTAEPLGVRTIGVGGLITVAASAPLSRRQAKRAGITKADLEEAGRRDLEVATSAS